MVYYHGETGGEEPIRFASLVFGLIWVWQVDRLITRVPLEKRKEKASEPVQMLFVETLPVLSGFTQGVKLPDGEQQHDVGDDRNRPLPGGSQR